MPSSDIENLIGYPLLESQLTSILTILSTFTSLYSAKSNKDLFDLHDVTVNYNETNLNLSHGTKLVLTGLNDNDYWRGKNLESFKSSICKLISPYKKLRPFNVYLSVPVCGKFSELLFSKSFPLTLS